MSKIKKGLVHLKNGTLLEAMRERWRYHKSQSRKAWWTDHERDIESFIVTVEPNVRMMLRLKSDMARLIYCCDFEWKERRFLNAFLRPGDIFVDIGANIGLFALIAAKRVGPLGKVIAFEPTPKIYDELCENVRLNGFGNITCVQKALSNCEDMLPLFVVTNGFDDYNSFAKPITVASFTEEKVLCMTWDSFAAKEDLIGKVTMIKIDVEGWESRVLQGGASFFSRDDAPVLQVEFTDDASLSAGSSCRQLYRLLEEFGYKMFRYDHFQKNIIPDPLRANYPYLNLIATKKPEEIHTRIHSFWRKVFFRMKLLCNIFIISMILPGYLEIIKKMPS